MAAPGVLAAQSERAHQTMLEALEQLAPDHPRLAVIRDKLASMAVSSGKDSQSTVQLHAEVLALLCEFWAAASAAVPARAKGGKK
jgi:hypothetical protein